MRVFVKELTLLEFIEVTGESKHAEAADFLASCDWPFHSCAKLTPEQAQKTLLDSEQNSRAFLILKSARAVGLIRILDLDDIEDGSPIVDVRIAQDQRNKGIATTALRWLVGKCFFEYDNLVRIEATTREDNGPMQLVLEKCGFRHEGRLRKAWYSESGERLDTMVYGILRGESEFLS